MEKSLYLNQAEIFDSQLKEAKETFFDDFFLNQFQQAKVSFLQKQRDTFYVLDFMAKHLPIDKEPLWVNEIVEEYLRNIQDDIKTFPHNAHYFQKEWEQLEKKEEEFSKLYL